MFDGQKSRMKFNLIPTSKLTSLIRTSSEISEVVTLSGELVIPFALPVDAVDGVERSLQETKRLLDALIDLAPG